MNEVSSNTTNGNHGRNGAEQVDSRITNRIMLHLTVTDPDVCSELRSREDEEERSRYALAAIRIGVQAMRQASGVIDAVSVREEGGRIVQSLREVLVEHIGRHNSEITGSLRQYFDPSSGQLSQRLDRLVKKDGDLDSLLHRHLAEDTSTVSKTLASHIGEQSPLFKLLSPDQANGVLASLRDIIQKAMQAHRDQIVKQFSLDDKSSALSRLLAEVSDSNGQLRKGLASDVAEVRKEFSLDNEDGALTRLVKRVEAAQKTISDQFSHDNEDSAMSRMAGLLESVNKTVKASLTLDDDASPLSLLRRQFVELIGQIEKSNGQFHSEIRETMATLTARKNEKARSTRHGDDFQKAVEEFAGLNAGKRGDILENTTTKSGRIPPRCRKGDFVITLGPESAAAGGKIVIEAKQEQGLELKAMLAEIGEARTNRDSSVGVFVLSSKAAAEQMEPLARYGNDIVVVWDAEDSHSDIVFSAALSLARALVIRIAVESHAVAAELSELDDAMQRIAKDASGLAEIITWSATVETNGNKIRTKAERLKQDLDKQVERLNEHLGRLRTESAMSA